VERRMFLETLTCASLGIFSANSLPESVPPQTSVQGSAPSAANTAFETSKVEVSNNTVFFRRYGGGPAILLVHGFPRTSLMWRFLAPKLAENHTVICVDLRA
jgi:haloacetate dehalogenase